MGVASLAMLENKEKIAEHKRRNREMFDAIAQRYDVLNHLLSGGIDIYWRRRALDSLQLLMNRASSTWQPGRPILHWQRVV